MQEKIISSPVSCTGIVIDYLIMAIYKYLIKVNIAGICETSQPCPQSFIPTKGDTPITLLSCIRQAL